MDENSLDALILKLHDVEAVKFGTFKLKSGISSPIYFDLRVIVSYPELMTQVSELLYQRAVQSGASFDCVCGVPYTALPLATIMCSRHRYPMLIRRKEAKDYGTKRMIEGAFGPGDVCLIVEDVVTSGGSVTETARELRAQGLKVRDAVVLLDREQGGGRSLDSEGVSLHPVASVSRLLDVLVRHGRVDEEASGRVRTFIGENQTCGVKRDANAKVGLSYGVRAGLPRTHPLAKRLFTLMEEKRTNLCLSADVTSSRELLDLAESLGPLLCVLKTHVDLLQDFSPETAEQLQKISRKHDFLIFEDRKFCDIGNTVRHQYEGGVYRICSWAHMVNAHSTPGPGVIEGLKAGGRSLGRGCLLIAQMSSEGALITDQYTHATVQMAEHHSDFVFGFISGSKVSDKPEHVHMTPGVQLQRGGDGFGQQYSTPDEVVRSKGSDVIIVGRGILRAEDRLKAAEEYRRAGWDAYISRISAPKQTATPPDPGSRSRSR